MLQKFGVLLVAATCALSSAAQTRSSVLLTPAPPATEVTFTGLHGNTFTYDRVLLDLLASPSVATFDCTMAGAAAKCLFAKKLDGSNSCGSGALDYSICGLAGAKSDQRFCVVSDEQSQVGLALSMASDEVAKQGFRNWVNGVRMMLGPEPRRPLWVAAVDGSGPAVRVAPTTNDDASDATARILSALYIAASRDAFGDAERREFRLLADELSRSFLDDFVRPIRRADRRHHGAHRRLARVRAQHGSAFDAVLRQHRFDGVRHIHVRWLLR